jgi:hypothetical protein
VYSKDGCVEVSGSAWCVGMFTCIQNGQIQGNVNVVFSVFMLQIKIPAS